MGIIAQQVERDAPSSPRGLVWQDPATGRKALSHSRLLVALVAAFQHLDAAVLSQGKARDDRLGELARASAAAAESSGKLSERLGAIESMTKIGLESLLAQARNVSSLEGRLSAEGSQVREVAVALATVQESVAQEKRVTEEWRTERSGREQELEKEVADLKARLAAAEELASINKEEQESRQKAQDVQIQALSLRIGTIHASQSHNKCESILAEVEGLRRSHRELEERLAGLVHRLDEDSPSNEEAFFLEEIRRIEDRLRDGLLNVAAAQHDAAEVAVDASSRIGGNNSPASPAAAVADADVLQSLRSREDSVRLGALEAVRRRRDHLRASRGARVSGREGSGTSRRSYMRLRLRPHPRATGGRHNGARAFPASPSISPLSSSLSRTSSYSWICRQSVWPATVAA